MSILRRAQRRKVADGHGVHDNPEEAKRLNSGPDDFGPPGRLRASERGVLPRDQLQEIGAARTSTDAFIRFVDLALVDVTAIWQRANDDQRRRVRQILFSEGLLIDSERKLSNPSSRALFNVLESMIGEK